MERFEFRMAAVHVGICSEVMQVTEDRLDKRYIFKREMLD